MIEISFGYTSTPPSQYLSDWVSLLAAMMICCRDALLVTCSTTNTRIHLRKCASPQSPYILPGLLQHNDEIRDNQFVSRQKAIIAYIEITCALTFAKILSPMLPSRRTWRVCLAYFSVIRNQYFE